jgi:hypothetical protein
MTPAMDRAARIGLFVLGLCLGGASPAAAEPERSDLDRHILEEDHDLALRRFTLARVRISHPQQFSAGVGALWSRQPLAYDCSTVCELRGWILAVEPGLAGAELSGGYAVVAGETGRNRHYLSRMYRAYGVRGAVMRTWGQASLSPPTETLVGVETDFTIIGLSFSLGAFHPVGADAPSSWVISGGVGWGF